MDKIRIEIPQEETVSRGSSIQASKLKLFDALEEFSGFSGNSPAGVVADNSVFNCNSNVELLEAVAEIEKLTDKISTIISNNVDRQEIYRKSSIIGSLKKLINLL